MSAPSGILLVDKPAEWTSHDVVARTRRLAGTRKVGHAGTLDPMATGLLVLGIGSTTRLLTYLVGVDKEYLATIRLGASTTTDDADGELLGHAGAEAVAALRHTAIVNSIAGLTGSISQVPSAVSAIKVDGKRAYARVRAGEQVELAAREVTVSAFDLIGQQIVHDDDGRQWLDLAVRVECSSGTYVRALARDLGFMLGVGGHLTRLRRSRVGPFPVRDAAVLDGIDLASRLLPPAAAASALFDVVDLGAQQAVDLAQGKRPAAPGRPDTAGPLAAIAPDGRLVGLVEIRGSAIRSLVIFPPDDAPAGTTARDRGDAG